MNTTYNLKIADITGALYLWYRRQFKTAGIKKLLLAVLVLFSAFSVSALNTYTNLRGSFDDGSGTMMYTNSFNGTYLIQPLGASRVNLSFTFFNTETNFDFVYVYDGSSEYAPLIGKYHNGNMPPEVITSTGNSLFIKFTTDSSVALDGWTAQYGGIVPGSGKITPQPLYPPNDASVIYSTQYYNNKVDSNYCNKASIRAEVSTNSGNSFTSRCYIGLDLSSIPANASVTSARLFLYSDSMHKSGSIAGYSGYMSNACWLERTTIPWNEAMVTWNTWTFPTSVNHISLDSSTSINQDYSPDITVLVKDMLDNPGQGTGLLIRLQSEVAYCTMSFYSSEFGTQSKRPRLELTYTLGGIIETLTSTKNYIYSLTPKVAVSDLALVGSDDLTEEVVYFDGLGRPIQKTLLQTVPCGTM